MIGTRDQQRGALLLAGAALALLGPAPLTAQPLATFTGQTGGVLSVAFSPDGKRIVSGSADGTVKLWKTQPAKTPEKP